MAIETMRKAYARDEVRELIQMREKALRDYESGLTTAREQGREEGREEIARQMLARGVERGLILDVTGFSEEELATLERSAS